MTPEPNRTARRLGLAALVGALATVPGWWLMALSPVASASLAPPAADAGRSPGTRADAAEARQPVRSPAPDAGLAGSDACADCHPEVWSEWAASSHRFTIAPAGPDSVAGSFTPADLDEAAAIRVEGHTWPRTPDADAVGVELRRIDGRYWAIFDRADDFIARNFEPTSTGRYAFSLDYTLGKLFYQTYLTRLPGGDVWVTPVLWDIREERWRLAGWRPWGRDCASCHVTGLELQAEPAGSAGPAPYSDPPRWVSRPNRWLEPHVGCEICHGPGGEHVASPTADNVVDPADLPPRAQLDLCGTCHGMAVANAQTYSLGDPVDPPTDNSEVPPGSRVNAFWPTGQHKTYFTMYQGMLRSAHWQRARLTCAPCHPAHGLGTRYTIEDDRQCTLCHTAYARRTERHTHHPAGSAGSRCVNCHMPRNNRFTLVPDVVLMTHVHSHDFSIPDPATALRHGVPDACSQCHAAEGPSWIVEQRRKLWGDPATTTGSR